jgi:hypothetical protein
MKARPRTYPFVPKSSKFLEPGDFWAVPLSDGSFACGRVLEHMPTGTPGARVGFLGGLLDWHGASPPEERSIAGASAFLAQGVMHILAITETGGRILGWRSLELDRLAPWTFAFGNVVQRGFTPIRPYQRTDRGLPSLSWWGYDVIQIHANRHFVQGQPIHS